MLLGRLRIATLVACLALPTLIAFTVDNGLTTLSAYRADAAFDKVLVAKALALAGVRLSQALPGEAFAPPEKLAAARQESDAAFAEIDRAYGAWTQSGGGDPTLKSDFELIGAKRALVPDYRQKIDANDPASVAVALGVLQPASGAGLDFVRRLSEMVEDPAISRALGGVHALLQYNDGVLIEVRPGEAMLESGAIDFQLHAFGMRGHELVRTYAPVLRDLLPADLAAEHDAFEAGPEAQFSAKVVKAMVEGARGDLRAADVPHWNEAAMARVGLNQKLIGRTLAHLNELTLDRKAELHNAFLLRLAVSLSVLVVGLGVMGAALMTLRALFGAVTGRMQALAEGDKTSPIPLSDRKDELGDIARALETFRQAALRNDQLEAQALAERAAAEKARRDSQAAAERDAEAWMEATTRAFAEGLHRLAAGDLSFELREKLSDRFETLRADFNASVRKLRETMQTVSGAAGTVGGRSTEISASADRLAAASARQAAALGETSAALGEIAANVQATAGRASEARASVGDTRQRAERADAVMRRAIAAMQKIEASSKQIAQINSAVDEIAFQTNLLALNAGVEAARAGESGRGFAVVAQEVRELALRSAGAAKEIGQLVANSAASIGEGVRQVNGAGEELRAIGESVAKVDSDVSAIAEAAREQARGLGEMSKTLSNLDRETRENAGMVSELNAAGSDLAADANELNQLMNRFQTGERRLSRAA